VVGSAPHTHTHTQTALCHNSTCKHAAVCIGTTNTLQAVVYVRPRLSHPSNPYSISSVCASLTGCKVSTFRDLASAKTPKVWFVALQNCTVWRFCICKVTLSILQLKACKDRSTLSVHKLLATQHSTLPCTCLLAHLTMYSPCTHLTMSPCTHVTLFTMYSPHRWGCVCKQGQADTHPWVRL
jgi:hypothetical protein